MQQEIVNEELEDDSEIKTHAAMLLVVCVLLAGMILASFEFTAFFRLGYHYRRFIKSNPANIA